MAETFLILGSFPVVLLPWFRFIWRSFSYENRIKEETLCQLDYNFMFKLVFSPQQFKRQYCDQITSDLMHWLIQEVCEELLSGGELVRYRVPGETKEAEKGRCSRNVDRGDIDEANM